MGCAIWGEVFGYKSQENRKGQTSHQQEQRRAEQKREDTRYPSELKVGLLFRLSGHIVLRYRSFNDEMKIISF